MDLPAKKRKVYSNEVDFLNNKYKELRLHERIEEMYRDFEPSEIMLTSSFAATSAFLLKLISEVNKEQLVYFIDTGYHFEETIRYKKKLSSLFNLKVKSISAATEEHRFTTTDETWNKNPDFCCYINKVKPLDKIKAQYSVWVSGLMEWQNDHRATLDIFENRGEILRFHPLLDISRKERNEYMENLELPFHPLVKKGYHSIGCTHCTVAGELRSGRWNNDTKTECGLHL